MSTKEKLIKKAINNPASLRFDELKTLLEYFGYEHVRTTGSHTQFRNSSGNVITIKIENPVKPVYVKDALNRIGENNGRKN